MKILLFYILALLIGALSLAQPSYAQSDDSALVQSFERLNATPAVRSPAFKAQDYIFSTRILDINRQLVGYVRDMVMNERGELQYLDGEITRGGDGTPRRLYNVEDITFLENVSAWEVPLDSYENDIDRNALYNMQAMIGAEVKDIGGGWLGKVKHVLLDEEAQHIAALVLNEVPGAGRYDDLALPFDVGYLTIRKRYDTVEFRVNRGPAQSFRDFARAR